MAVLRGLALLLALLLPAVAAALENQLAGHASPYLAMHGGDPVAWQDWGPDVLARARAEDKLLFISSGYFSCHWCHVMQRESYRDENIAALLNANFIPVKLDRELHGALDAHLIDFLERTQGQAGWPLNVFLTPEGYPLIGATYLPPERFHALLQRLDSAWRQDRGRLRDLARQTQSALAAQPPVGDIEVMTASQLRAGLLDQAMQLADVMGGGFGDQNKFPMAPQLLALLDLQAAAPSPQLAGFLDHTLQQMAAEGLRDHLGGGFFRYTVDPGWETPHFEKMLYSQALLAEVYLRAAKVFDREAYAAVAHETLAFVLREMQGPQGGYVAAFSAVDGAGEEGGVYLWGADELTRLLGEDEARLARRHWRMPEPDATTEPRLPRRGEPAVTLADELGRPVAEVEEGLADARRRLLEARARRDLPVDDKELAGWNGLLLAALSQAAERWDDPQWRTAAQRVRDFLHGRLWDGSELRRAVAGDRPLGEASLADYAYVAYGMAQYARLSGDPADQVFVETLLRQAWRRFLGPGGWRLDDRPLLPGVGEEPALAEGALPAPSAMLIRLALRSDDPELRGEAIRAAQNARAIAQSDPFWYSGHLGALLEAAAVASRGAE